MATNPQVPVIDQQAITAALAIISSYVPGCPARVSALPPSAITAVLAMRSCRSDEVS